MKALETRQRLTHAGVEELQQARLPLTFPLVRIGRAIELTGASRASAYRLFRDPRREIADSFADAVLIEMANDFESSAHSSRPNWLEQLMGNARRHGADQDIEALEADARQVFDQFVERALSSILGSTGAFLIHTNAAMVAVRHPTAELATALTNARHTRVVRQNTLLEEALAALAIQVAPAWTTQILSDTIYDIVVASATHAMLHHGFENGDKHLPQNFKAPVVESLKVRLAAILQSALVPDTRMIVAPDIKRVLKVTTS